MAKRVRKSDDFYRESLSWMAYRYAIGITEYVGRSGKSEAERYRMFRDIEFDTGKRIRCSILYAIPKVSTFAHSL